MSDKKKFTRVTTPPGIARYPKLNTPDTKYKKDGEYSTKLVLPGDEAQPIIDQYEAELAEFFEAEKQALLEQAEKEPKNKGKLLAKAKGLKLCADRPFKAEVDEETGEETGNWVFNFKMPARIAREGKPDLVLKPDFFDAGGKKLSNPPEIWGGSKIKVAADFRPFNTQIGVGISLRLCAVQIIELRQGGSRDASDYGFGAEEGYSAEDEEDTTSTTSAGSDASDADDNKDF